MRDPTAPEDKKENSWRDRAIAFAVACIDAELTKYADPNRVGLPKGADVGLSLKKRRTASLAGILYHRNVLGLREIARMAGVSEKVLSVWRTQPPFQKAQEEVCEKFGEAIAVTMAGEILGRRMQTLAGLEGPKMVVEETDESLKARGIGRLNLSPQLLEFSQAMEVLGRRARLGWNVTRELRDHLGTGDCVAPLTRVISFYNEGVAKALTRLFLEIEQEIANSPHSEAYPYLKIQLMKIEEEIFPGLRQKHYRDPKIRKMLVGVIFRYIHDLKESASTQANTEDPLFSKMLDEVAEKKRIQLEEEVKSLISDLAGIPR